jgi:hypothetical protein
MLIEDFFEAVDRAFIDEARRIPALRRLELQTPLELHLSAPQNLQATSPSSRTRALRLPLRPIED